MALPSCYNVICDENIFEEVPKDGKFLQEQALVEAAALGDYEKVFDLLTSGVSVDAEEYNKLLYYASKNYMTPLHKAAENGYVNCVQLLIDQGADVNIKDRFGITPLHIAAEKGNYLCLKALLEANADCSLSTKYSKPGCFRGEPYTGGTTALHLAAAKNHIDCVKELIQYGADYNAVDKRGRTSLYIAAELGFEECVLIHLKHAVGQDILSLPSFETSDTPLHFAVSRNMIEAVHELVSLGSDINHINYMGCSPLHLAVATEKCLTNALEILDLLVLKGYNTDVNLPDVTNSTPLHYVSFIERTLWRRRPEMAKFLIAYGANVNIKNNSGQTLLECELKSSKDDEILKYIIRSLLQLPRLMSLNISTQSEPYLPVDMPLNRPPNHDINLQILGMHRNLLMPTVHPHGHHPYLAIESHSLRAFANYVHHEGRSQPSYLRYHYISRFNYHDVFDDESVSIFRDRIDLPESDNLDSKYNIKICPWSLKRKQVWYDKLSSNPRKLQHICRFVIRQTLGCYKLKYIKKLPIPSLLHSYLLLEYGE